MPMISARLRLRLPLLWSSAPGVRLRVPSLLFHCGQCDLCCIAVSIAIVRFMQMSHYFTSRRSIRSRPFGISNSPVHSNTFTTACQNALTAIAHIHGRRIGARKLCGRRTFAAAACAGSLLPQVNASPTSPGLEPGSPLSSGPPDNTDDKQALRRASWQDHRPDSLACLRPRHRWPAHRHYRVPTYRALTTTETEKSGIECAAPNRERRRMSSDAMNSSCRRVEASARNHYQTRLRLSVPATMRQ
jgi:hypothetical protein